jgi:hypothetical protein
LLRLLLIQLHRLHLLLHLLHLLHNLFLFPPPLLSFSLMLLPHLLNLPSVLFIALSVPVHSTQPVR